MSSHDTLALRFHEARCLAAAGRADEAHAIFLECVVGQPESAFYATEYLANLARRSAVEEPAAPSKADEADLKRAVAQQNWTAVAALAPPLLAISSRRLPLLLALAAAAEGQGHVTAQAVYLKAAADLAADNADIHRQAAKVFARLERIDEALVAWQHIARLTSDDAEASQAITALTIAKSRQRAGLIVDDDQRAAPLAAAGQSTERDGITRFVVTHPEALGPAVSSPAGIPLTAIQKLEAAIRDRPSIPDLYLRLAQVYLDKDRDFDAERLLRKGREATDNDARVLQMWEEVTLVRHRARVEAAQREAQAQDNPQTQEALAQAQKERSRAELDIYRQRVKRDPQDAIARLDLGRCLAQADKMRDAEEHFGVALAAAAARPVAALALGRCLEDHGDVAGALKHYRQAADAAGPDHRPEQVAALYAAARLALKIKLARLAQRYLARLLRIDPGHKDAAALMQSV